MNNIKLTVFDAFSYLVPGCVLLAIIIWATGSAGFEKISFAEAGLGILLGYALGFVIDAVSSAIFLRMTQRAMDRLMGKIKYSKVFVICDARSRDMRLKVEQLNAMSGMARNLAVCIVVIFVLNWARGDNWLFPGDLDRKGWYGLSLTIVFTLLMLKAYQFRKWAHDLLNQVYLLKDLPFRNTSVDLEKEE